MLICHLRHLTTISPHMTIEISINGWQGKPDGMRIRNVNVNHLGRPEVMGRYSEAND